MSRPSIKVLDDQDRNLIAVQRIIENLSIDEKEKVYACAGKLRLIVEFAGPLGNLALALVGAEKAAEK